MTDCKIEQHVWRGCDWSQLLAYSIENLISHEKRRSLLPKIYNAIKPLLLSQYHKSGSTFSSSKPVEESCPKSLAVDFAL